MMIVHSTIMLTICPDYLSIMLTVHFEVLSCMQPDLHSTAAQQQIVACGQPAILVGCVSQLHACLLCLQLGCVISAFARKHTFYQYVLHSLPGGLQEAPKWCHTHQRHEHFCVWIHRMLMNLPAFVSQLPLAVCRPIRPWMSSSAVS